jgi:hypothetical protein
MPGFANASCPSDPPIAHLDSLRRRGCDIFAVRDHEQSSATFMPDTGQNFQHHLRGLRVEIAGGFVGDEQRRLVNQGARNRGALLLAPAELMDKMPGAFRHPNYIEELARAPFDFA